MGIWSKIKSLFDFNKDGKFTAEDLAIAQALADKKIKDANETINAFNDQITDAVTQVKASTERVKVELKQVEDKVGAVVKTVKAKRKPKKK
jgi:hypothetical protein